MKKSKNDVEKLKLDILDTAEAIFLKKNYSEVNVREITEQLGITRTPLYYHFSSKLEIYMQVVERYLDRKVELFCGIHHEKDSFFVKVKKDLTLCNSQNIQETTLFSEIVTNPELADILQKRRETFDQIYDLKRFSVQEAVKRGELREDVDPEEVVDYLYLIHFGLTEMCHCNYHTFSQEAVDRLICQQIEGMQNRFGK
ncbi:MAG: TetR/AcrR family transcriptional regulator [Anaerovoracaceae bacterium]